MSVDVYQNCPCGSGKKLKFCCAAIATDMRRALDLQQAGQRTQALREIEKIQAKNPDNLWVLFAKASLLLEDDLYAELLKTTDQILEVDPQHAGAYQYRALALLGLRQHEPAIDAIQQMLEYNIGSEPDITSWICQMAAAWMLSQGCLPAGRQFMRMAAFTASPEARSQLIQRLMDFDGSEEIWFPLRADYTLAIPPEHCTGQDLERARELTRRGCYIAAVPHLAAAAQQYPKEPAILQNLGLCSMWAGQHTAAAEALHRAAQLLPAFDDAVDLETLAQCLERLDPTDWVTLQFRRFQVGSVSRLLTRLDQQPHFARVPVPPPAEEQTSPVPVAMYRILDRELPATVSTPADVARVLAQVTVFPAEGAQPAYLMLLRYDNDQAAAVDAQFLAAAGEDVSEAEGELPQSSQTGSVARELYPLTWQWHFADTTPVVTRRRLEKQQWDHQVYETWPNLSQRSLGGKTPAAAKDDPALRIALGGALNILDAFCDIHRYVLHLDTLRERLHLPQPVPPNFDEQTRPTRFPFLALRRLPLPQLSDEQLGEVLEAARLVGHEGYLYDVLSEVVARPSFADEQQSRESYFELVELCRSRHNKAESLAWVTRGREAARHSMQAFEVKMLWDLKELSLRLEDPEDPQLLPLLRFIWSTYVPKIPSLKEQLLTVLSAYHFRPAFLDAETGTDLGGSSTPGGIWTPESAAAATAATGKLWLPGQD